VLKAMEEAGRIRRGYFVAGLGAAQFAMPAALDLVRSMRDLPETPRTVVMAATDPANPYGSIVKWPLDSLRSLGTSPVASLQLPGTSVNVSGPTRSAGALVILVDGFAAAYLRRGERELLLFLPDAEPSRSRTAREVARMLLHLAGTREGRRGMLIAEINSGAATAHPAARLFLEEGFAATAMGLQARTDRLRPRGYGSLDPSGIGIAVSSRGGASMAQQRDEAAGGGAPVEEVEVVRGELKGEDIGDIDEQALDPDSAESQNDRDDTMDE
jgi:hypothetical protein